MKRVLSFLLTVCLMACLLPTPAHAATDIQIGEYLQMGVYYGEPILWRCVDIDENGPLMLADKILCIKAFDAEPSFNTATGSHSRSRSLSSCSNYWGDSNLRSWLNSTASSGNVTWLCGNPPVAGALWTSGGYSAYDQEAGFLSNFTQSERNAMKKVHQKSLLSYPEIDAGMATMGAERHTYSPYIDSVVQNYDTAYAEYVTDKMFLLDVKQINAVYNNGSTLGADYYIGEPTAACVANSEYKHSFLAVGNKWYSWLRSPYSSGGGCPRHVEPDGSPTLLPPTPDYGVGVRPAFYLDLPATSIQSGTGAEANPYIISGGSGGTQPTPVEPCDTVEYLTGWDAASRQITFVGAVTLSPYTYTLAESMDTSNIENMLNKYVLVTAEQGDSVLDYTVTDLRPVTSAIGTVTATDEHALTIGGTTYPVREDFMLASYDGQEILYHTDNGTIVGIDVLEEKSGTLEAWDSATGRATIDGVEYPTNFLTDTSFSGNVDEYLNKNVTYFVSGGDSYKPLIRIDGVVEVESEIAVFSTEKSLTVKAGDSMWLGFGKIADGEIIGDWKRMAIVVSDPTVISLSEYEETEYGYSLEVTGKKQGATNVTITDTESGAHTVIVINVRDAYVGTYSYAIDNMETFYPNNEWEGSVQTNIYNLNGLYVNNYQCSKGGDSYAVSFDAYNSKYHTAAVDIYNADGKWIDCEEIKKYSMISSLWDTGEQAYYLISDAVNGKLLTYEQASFAEHTPISIKVPDGGYFTISNNFAESPGAFLFNSCDILYDGICTLIDAAVDIKNDKVRLSAFSNLVKDEIAKDKTVREQFIEIFKKSAKKEAQKCLKKFATNEIDDRYADISGLFENLLNSLDISWKHLFKSATGVGESAFTKFAGPAGIALKGCFAFTKGGNQLVQAVHLAASVDAPYATVFSSIDEGSINPHGVIVNTNSNMDPEAELHVFRVSNDDTIEVVLNGSGGEHLKKYELYNICFVKNDQYVQPSGKVTVRIPIPDGMKGDTCCVYRQESNGTWSLLTAHIEGNYLVFETDHFSLYGIVGAEAELVISSLPDKTLYSVGDILDPNGLALSLGGELIADGFICEPTVLAQAGTQKVTVQYGVASTEFSVSVQAKADDGSSGGGSTGGSSTGSSSTGGGSTGGGSAGGAGGSGSSGSSGSSGTPKVSFTDVASDAWYYAAVQYVAEHSLMAGYDNNRFGPEDNVTRGQFAQILYNKEGKPAVTTSADFTDISDDAWYAAAVAWAAKNKVVSGYGNGKYGPNNDITREQLAVMLYRYAGEPWAAGTLSGFTDADEASGYAVDALRWAADKGILTGKGGGILDPKGNATRAEVAAILMRYLENT